jgi:hypothetical protein
MALAEQLYFAFNVVHIEEMSHSPMLDISINIYALGYVKVFMLSACCIKK